MCNPALNAHMISVASAEQITQLQQQVQPEAKWNNRNFKKICYSLAGVEGGVGIVLIMAGGALRQQVIPYIGAGLAISGLATYFSAFYCCSNHKYIDDSLDVI